MKDAGLDVVKTMVVFLFLAVAVAVAVSAVGGCTIRAKRFDYHPAEETPEGPGIFTGKEGAVTIGR